MNVLQEITVPQESVNDETATVVEVFFRDGDFVETDDILIELETSKVLFSLDAETNGYIKYFCKEGDDVKINTTVIKIFDSQDIPADMEQENQDSTDLQIVQNTIFSDAALKYLKEKNLDVKMFSNKDFVSKNDVLSHFNLIPKTEEKQEKQLFSEIEILPDIVQEKLTKTKITEIQYLSNIQKSGLTSTVNMYINTSNIFDFINPSLKYFKYSLLPVITFETAKLLSKFPEFNAYYTGDSVAIYTKVNIGIAVDMDMGLKTVKIADTDKKTLNEIENDIFDLSNKYIDKKLQIDDLSNITFTISDLSGEGVSFFRPLINKHNSAILAVSANDDLLNRTILTLTFDHRVTDGRKATIFLRELKNRIESYNSGKNIPKIKCFKCMKSLSEDYNNVGFLKTLTSDGSEKYICQTCFNGF